MNILNIPKPIWEAPDANPSDPTPNSPPADPAAFEWGDIDDPKLAEWIGDRSPQEIAAEGLKHRNSATGRKEQIIKEALDDEDFLKNLSENHGLMSAPKDEDSLIELARSQINEETKYEHPELDLADPTVMDAWASAAREVGVVPSQYKTFVEKAYEFQKVQSEDSAQSVVDELKKQWGDDFSENEVRVQDFMRSVGDDDRENLLAVISLFPPKLQVNAANVLAKMGARIGTAERNGDGGVVSSTGSGDPQADWESAKALLKEKGNDTNNLTDAEREEMTRSHLAFKKWNEEKNG